MPEYIGYQPGATMTDWSKLTGALGATVQEAIGTRSREREAFNQTLRENQEKINQYEAGQNQTMNTLVFDGANNIRNMMYEWKKAADNGEMTRADFKDKMNNVQSYWGMLSTAAKSFDTRTMETLKRQQPDDKGMIPGSGFEMFVNKKHSEIADLKNKQIYANPVSGKIYLTKMGENGEVEEEIDVRQMNNPGNMLDNRVNLSSAVIENTKGWKDWSIFQDLGQGATRTITDARKNPQYVTAKNALIKSIVANDRSAASVLADNGAGDYSFYTNEQEFKSGIESKIETAREIANETGEEFDESAAFEQAKSEMILTSKDDTGTWQPRLTDDQMKAAKARVEAEIEMSLGMKEKGTSKHAPNRGVTVNVGDEGVKPEDFANYATIKNAWETGDFSALQVASPDYRFSVVKDDKTGLPKQPYTVDVQKVKWDSEAQQNVVTGSVKVKDARSLAPFLMGTGTGAKGVPAIERYDREKERFQAAQSGKEAVMKNKPSYTEADIQATMKANPGVTREQVIKAFENE